MLAGALDNVAKFPDIAWNFSGFYTGNPSSYEKPQLETDWEAV